MFHPLIYPNTKKSELKRKGTSGFFKPISMGPEYQVKLPSYVEILVFLFYDLFESFRVSFDKNMTSTCLFKMQWKTNIRSPCNELKIVNK